MQALYNTATQEEVDFFMTLSARGWSPHILHMLAPHLFPTINPTVTQYVMPVPCQCGGQQPVFLEHLRGVTICSVCRRQGLAVNALAEMLRVRPKDFVATVRQIVYPGDCSLPSAALHGLAGQIVTALLPYTEADPAATLLHLLTYFGICVGDRPHAVVSATRHPARLFAVVVGRTATARKGTADGFPRELFSRVDPDFVRLRRCNGLSTGQGLIHALAPAAGSANPVDGRLLAVESEFGQVLTNMARQSNNLSQVIRQAWDDGNLSNLTKNAPAHAHNAHVGIIGHCTFAELDELLPRTQCLNGFSNRFLWVLSDRRRLLPDPASPPAGLMDFLCQRLHDAIAFARNTGEVRRDASANVLWDQWYLTLPQGTGTLGAVLGRDVAYVLRLSLVYALLDRSPVIQEVHLRAALAVWDYCCRSAALIFGDPRRSNKTARKIWEALQSASGGLDRTAVSAHFSRHVLADKLDAAFKQLLDAGLIDCRQEQTGGHPRTVYFAKKTPSR